MKALILAAGLGTRLRPLTDRCPKALVSVGGQSLLERNILFLKSQGISGIIVNVHHFGEQIIDFVRQRDFGIPISISDERGLLLDTGGAIRHAADFLIYNVDVLSNISLKKMYGRHRQQQNLVTMAVRHRSSSRQLLFGDDLKLLARHNPEEGLPAEARHAAAFSGIHMLSTRIFRLLPEEEAFPIMPVYLQLAQSENIRGYFHDEDFWMDMGRPEQIATVERMIRNNEEPFRQK